METDIKRFTVHSSQFTVFGIIKKAEKELKDQGIPNPRYDAEVLLSRALNIDRLGLYTQYDRILSDEEVVVFLGLVERRKKREPLQYILGKAEFCDLEFLVTPEVLIPRPETELLVEETVKQFTVYCSLRSRSVPEDPMEKEDRQFTDKGSRFMVLDLCTGSGCVSVALAKKLKDARVYAVDISEKAIRVAKENARRHGVEERIRFIQGDLFEPLKVHGSRFTVHGSQFDLIISNPPYIPGGEIDFLQREVKDYEPREALDGGPDGLSYIKRIIEDAPHYLKRDGSLLLEIGYGQKERVCELAEKRGTYRSPEVIKDFAGIERVVKWIRS